MRPLVDYRISRWTNRTDREGFPRVYTCSRHGTPGPGQWRWDGATPRCRKCRPPIRILEKRRKQRERGREKNARYFSRNVHCHDDKSGINRATSRLSININSGSTRAEARIRELDPPLPHVHTDRKMGVDIRSNLLRREQDLRRGSTANEASNNLDDFSSRGGRTLLLSRRPSSNGTDSPRFSFFFSLLLSFSFQRNSKGLDGIIESTCVSKKSEFPLYIAN